MTGARRSFVSLAPAVVVVLIGILAGAFAAVPASAEVEVKLRLPQRAKLDLRGKDSVSVTPFLVVVQEGERDDAARDVDVEGEFTRYLEKILRRETDLRIVEPGPVGYPTYDVDRLLENREFWQDLGERLQADLLVFGNLDFDVQDRTGYQTEEFVSPIDGRTYYRQVLVEETGYRYDILMFVIDGESGRVLYRDNFVDFRSFPSGDVDPIAGMFENLYSLEDRILSVFSQQEVEARRLLFTGTR